MTCNPLVVFLLVPLLQVFVCASVVSYVAFVWSILIPQFNFFYYLGRAVFRDCGIYWVSSLIYLQRHGSKWKLNTVLAINIQVVPYKWQLKLMKWLNNTLVLYRDSSGHWSRITSRYCQLFWRNIKEMGFSFEKKMSWRQICSTPSN